MPCIHTHGLVEKQPTATAIRKSSTTQRKHTALRPCYPARVQSVSVPQDGPSPFSGSGYGKRIHGHQRVSPPCYEVGCWQGQGMNRVEPSARHDKSSQNMQSSLASKGAQLPVVCRAWTLRKITRYLDYVSKHPNWTPLRRGAIERYRLHEN